MDNLYDRIGEVEDSIRDVNEKINGAYDENITAKELYKILLRFDKIYYKMTDVEKKEFLRNLIESIEIYPDRSPQEQVLKQINFKFPVYYDGDGDGDDPSNDGGDGGSDGSGGNTGDSEENIGCPKKIQSKL